MRIYCAEERRLVKLPDDPMGAPTELEPLRLPNALERADFALALWRSTTIDGAEENSSDARDGEWVSDVLAGLDGRNGNLLERWFKLTDDITGSTLIAMFDECAAAGRQIAEALINHRSIDRKSAEAEALNILERVRVPAARLRLHDYPHRFSGGMRQRVMIAMALACRPKLLIADEPTTALDVTVKADILELIKSLQDQERMSVLFITHDMGVVAEIADRVVVMWKGRKVEEGATADILTRPRHSYTQALIAAVPRLGSMRGEAAPKPFPEANVLPATLG
jgi:ATPase subunit of ABC transporter with duplicated ATPase domains